MDITERKNHKIAREAENSSSAPREQGVGTAEIDLIHALRHHPGCTQAALAELLHADKAAIARRTKNLLRPRAILSAKMPQRSAQPAFVSDREGREPMKSSKAEIEAAFYEYPDRRAARRRGRCLCGNAG